MNLESETICGYLVTAEQKRVNAVYLDLLQEFDRLCKQAGLTYWVSFGALLGAVRHKGFIPWDDDVDVVLPREDFDRLAKMTNEQFGAKEPYSLLNPVTAPAKMYQILAFRRSDTSSIQKRDWRALSHQPKDAPPPYNMGLGLSIFPLDSCGKSKFFHRVQCWTAVCVGAAYYRAFDPKPVRRPLNAVARWMLKILGPSGFFSLFHWPYRWPGMKNTGRVQILDGFYPQHFLYERAAFSGTVLLPFEDITIPAPSGYDSVLRANYGDYMQFPPPEARVPKHDVVCSADEPYPVTVKKLQSGQIRPPWDL